MTSPKLNAIAAALAAGVLLALHAPVSDAQTSRLREAREAREAAEKQGGSQAEVRFPNAKREEPKTAASKKFTPKLEALFEANTAGDNAKVEALGTEIAGDAGANAYEKSLAYRVMGASLVNDDPAKSQGYLEQAVATGGLGNNDHFDTMFIVAQLQLQEQQYDKALATIDAAIGESGSSRPEDLALRGNALYRLGRHDEAITTLKPLVDANASADPRIVQLLAAAYADSGKTAEATALSERAAAAAPQDKGSQLNLAASYMEAGQDAKAAEIYEKLRTSGQLTDEREYRNLFALYVNSDAEGASAKGLAAINEGIQKGIVKPDAKLYSVIGQVYYFSEQPGPAIDAYTKAAATATDGEASLNLAKILAEEGRDAESKKAAQQALDKGIKNPQDAKTLLAR